MKNVTNVSSNINEVIRAVLNSLFFSTKRFHTYIGGLTKSGYAPGLTKSVQAGMYVLTFAYLVSPVHLHCIVRTFLFFLLSIFFSCAQKTQKHK